MMRGVLFLIFLLVSVVPGARASAAEEPLRDVTLQLRWYHQFQFAGYYAALEQGFYREAGLNVTIRERDPAQSPIEQVLSGGAEFGVTNSELLLHRLRGKPLVALAAILQHSPLVMVARGTSDIRTPHDLVGKTVLMSTKSLDIEILAMLKAEQVDLSRFALIDNFARPADYFNTDIDALAAYITNQTYYYEQRGIPYTVLRPSSYGVDFYGDCVFTTRKMVETKPDVVKAFRAASLKGWDYAMSHPLEMIDIILNKYGSKKSRSHLLYEAARIRELMLPDLVEIGHMNPGRWEHIGETFASFGMVTFSDLPADFIYDPDPAPDYQKLWWGLAGLGAMLFCAIGIVVVLATFNRRLSREVQERKKAEEESRKARNYVQGIINSMPSVVVGVDAGGLVTHWNTAAEKSTGKPAAEVLGTPFAQYFPHVCSRMDTSVAFSHCELVGASRLLNRTTEGSRYEDVTIFPLIGDELEGAVVRIDDVTDKVRMEEILIQSEKMMSVGGLAAGMAHEINNPLGSILQGVQNVIRRIYDDLPDNEKAASSNQCTLQSIRGYMEDRKILRMLDGIREAGERAAKIVHNMLSFSRKTEAVLEMTDLCELIDVTVELAGTDYDMKQRFDFKKIELVREYEPDCPYLPCERSKIQQVIFNILRNGAEAMKQKQYPAGVNPRFVIRVRRRGGMVSVDIEDNGIGMSEAVRTRVFEPFFTTKPVGSGTGLGLSISYFIIAEEHQGTMAVASTDGKWTRFTFSLPISGPVDKRAKGLMES